MTTRPLIELKDTGVLWHANKVAFHPIGLALGIYTVDDEVMGWHMAVADDGVYTFPHEVDVAQAEKFAAFQDSLRMIG